MKVIWILFLAMIRRYKGSGIPYRFLRFNKDGLDVTVGSYYEQFGSGIIFRTYEERSLGYDNAMDGTGLNTIPLPVFILKA